MKEKGIYFNWMVYSFFLLLDYELFSLFIV